MDIKNIIPLEGLGDITFGMEPHEVEQILGKPEANEPMEEDGDSYESWHYDGLGLSILFENDGALSLLEMISISSPEFVLEGHSLIGLDKDTLIALMAELDDMEHEEEKEDDRHIISYDEAGIDFWLEGGKVVEVQWFPMYLEGVDLESEN